MYKKLGRDSTSLWSTLQHPLQRYGCRWPLNDKHLCKSLGLNHVLLFKITIISYYISLLCLFIFYGTHLELVLQSYALTKHGFSHDEMQDLDFHKPGPYTHGIIACGRTCRMRCRIAMVSSRGASDNSSTKHCNSSLAWAFRCCVGPRLHSKECGFGSCCQIGCGDN